MSDRTASDNPFLLSTSFRERTDQLFRELKRAVEFDRPAILLAVYRSEFVRQDVEAQLTEQLRGLQQQTTSIQVSEDKSDIPTLLVNNPNKENTVFFVRGLRWGGGEDGRNAYRALNIRREYLVDHRIRLVLWLTESELQNLAWFATDFWVFRHRTVEFVDGPEIDQVRRHVGKLIWQDWNDYTFQENTDAKITLREQLLVEIPSGHETDAARAQLLYSLAPLYSIRGNQDKALAAFYEALDLAQKTENLQLQALLYNGIGNIYRDSGRTDDAITAYQKAITLNPDDPDPWNGLGNVYQDMGHTDDAIMAYHKAIELDPRFSYPWNGLGNLYRNSGRIDEAHTSYQTAIRLNPQSSIQYSNLALNYRMRNRIEEAITTYKYALEKKPENASDHAGLAACYRELGLENEYQKEISLARQYMNEENEYSRACIEAIAGNTEEAVVLLEIALDKNQVDRDWLKRDPDLDFIRDDPRFQALFKQQTNPISNSPTP